ncbi:antitoxin Xre/MbcA/ParS toxin-binding domain-containing protein [Burkholderia sp. Bp9143]|uniref:antitoxin Xre/MbcA/ParS toxin-binding domain-containing protein n=1 Tax=Burkholderia sp. Bp9143 TaxID=2184574 RepID=UPI001627610D
MGIRPSQINDRPDGDSLWSVRACAREVFGSAAKADRWLGRPAIRFDGESPVTWVQNHNDPVDI